MPIKRASFKDLRKSKKRHVRNVSLSSELNSLTKKFDSLVAAKKTDEAKTFLKTLASKIDKAASKGIIHRNAASRRISRLTKKIASVPKA
ncbi:MAG: 30S ribosomal protein S20 [Candidatus Omnitrophota bacterium]|nr:30S ribosomal protein S20 [Candidatus Omnitrophota bacterium]